jgi:hypothetical protein
VNNGRLALKLAKNQINPDPIFILCARHSSTLTCVYRPLSDFNLGYMKLAAIRARSYARDPFEEPAKKRRVFVAHLPAYLIHRHARSFEPALCVFVAQPLDVIDGRVAGGAFEAAREAALGNAGDAALGAQAGEARLATVFKKAGFGKFRKAKATPFNLILEAKV